MADALDELLHERKGLIVVRTIGQAPRFITRDDDEPEDDGDGDDPSEVGAGSTGDTTETDEANAAPDVLGVVDGHFSTFDAWYEIHSWWEGDYIEQVAAGAFAKTFAERGVDATGGNRIVSNFDHGFDPQIGDKILGPFTDLSEDNVGGYYAFELLDTTFNRDLMPALKRGLYGSSFRFQVIKDAWNMEPAASDYNPFGLPERTLQEVRVFELGPVTYPASPTATAGMRSGSDAYYESLRARDPQLVDTLRSRMHQLRTAAKPAATSTGDPAAASQGTDEPALRHSGGLSHAQRRAALYPYLKGAGR